jgi:hypothetical protein
MSPDTYHIAKSSTTRTITKAYLACNRRLKLLAMWYTSVHIAKSYTTPTFTPDARKSVGTLWSVYGRFMASLWRAYRGFRAPRESSRYLHAAQIRLSRSASRAIIWLECIVHRRKKADIPDMLTIVTHAWILDTVKPQDIAVSTADRKTTNSRCTDSLGSKSLVSPVRERVACGASLTTGVLGGDRKAPDTSGRQRGAIDAKSRSV